MLVVADEIYEKILYEGETHYSIGAIPEVRDRVITINGYSKSYAMMGWRLGYSAANVRLTSEMMKMQQNTVTTASSISQYAAMASYRCQGNVANMVEEYEKRRNYLFDALQKIPCVTCYKPAGTFYMFFRIDYQGMNSFELAEYMLDRANVLVVPGEVYGIGGEKCIRFSFAAPMRDIEKAVARIQRIFQ